MTLNKIQLEDSIFVKSSIKASKQGIYDVGIIDRFDIKDEMIGH